MMPLQFDAGDGRAYRHKIDGKVLNNKKTRESNGEKNRKRQHALIRCAPDAALGRADLRA